jgi:hypothetical protein
MKQIKKPPKDTVHFYWLLEGHKNPSPGIAFWQQKIFSLAHLMGFNQFSDTKKSVSNN